MTKCTHQAETMGGQQC